MFYVATVKRERGQFLADFLDAPGCQTFAGSRAELRKMAHEALEGWLQAHLESGQAPPRPRRRRVRTGELAIEVDPALAVAVQLRWARLDAGLSQAQLARRAGVSQQQVAKLERPGQNPSIDTIAKLARALGSHPVLTLEPLAK